MSKITSKKSSRLLWHLSIKSLRLARAWKGKFFKDGILGSLAISPIKYLNKHPS